VVEISSEMAVWYTAWACSPYPCALGFLVRDPQGQFETQALLCTDLEADPENILSWFVVRWQIETTFQEVRRHLGFETQRQWSDLWRYGRLHRRS
jgi:hypothetical protein